jgi:hypothetical protein
MIAASVAKREIKLTFSGRRGSVPLAGNCRASISAPKIGEIRALFDGCRESEACAVGADALHYNVVVASGEAGQGDR